MKERFLLALMLVLLPQLGSMIQFESKDIELGKIFEKDVSESSLAFGGKLLFAACGVYELELIPGISDSLANKLLRARPNILKKASSLPIEQRYQAFELAHGVGRLTAKKLDQYLTF